MQHHSCIECGQPLHQYEQQCGPYQRNDAGELVGTGSLTLVECHNPACRLHMVTASMKCYPTTAANFLAGLRIRAVAS